MRPARSAAAVLVAVPLALTALGGPLASAADESSKSPKAILADVTRDLGQVRSYRFSGTEKDSGGTSTLSGAALASGQTDVTLKQGSTTIRLLRVSASAIYLKANAAYWKANGGKNGPALARSLDNRWVKAPSTTTQPFTDLFDQLAPKHMATCVAVGTGTLAKGGTATVGGKKAIIIVDKGDKPGTTAGKLYVSASGPALPLREVQTGQRRAGGHLDARCQDKDDDSSAGDVRFTDFGKVAALKAPKGAITLPSGGGGGTGPSI